MKTILGAVNYLHENSVVHRDLKTDNILLMDDTDFTSIKIIDFGFGA
jgi:serine/threonine protein kinase